MKTLILITQRALLGLFLVVGIAACDSSNAALEDDATVVDDVAQLSIVLADELNLTQEQQTAVSAAAAAHGDGDARDPGFLWYLAEELSETLSDEQIESLLARAEAMAQGFGERGHAGPFGGPGGPGARDHRGGGPGGDPLGQVLTDEQRDALRALHEEYADDRRALADAVRDAADDAARQVAIDALRAFHDQVREAVDAWFVDNLSADQQAQIEALRSEREAAREAARQAIRAAIQDVLGVSADELEEIHDQFVSDLETARAAFGAGTEEFRQAVEDAAAARDGAIQNLLSDEAYVIFKIHQALQVRAGHMRSNGGQRGPDGQGGPGGQGQGGPRGQGGPGGHGGPGQGGPGGFGTQG